VQLVPEPSPIPALAGPGPPGLELPSSRSYGHGFQLSRDSLSHWAARAIDLLAPIYRAQCEHIRHSRVLAMDETPIKAGRQDKGKMRAA